MAFPAVLASVVMFAAAPADAAPPPPAAPASPDAAAPETVTSQVEFLHEEGKAPFNGVSIELGMVLVKATIAGAETLAMIDLSTARSLVDVNLARRQGVTLGEPLDPVTWKGAQHERRRAHDVEVTLDGQMRVMSDVSAIELYRNRDGAPGGPGYVLGRGMLDHFALVLVLLEDKRFYGLSESGKWIAQTDGGTRAGFPYEGGIVTFEIDGTPVRLFVDLTSKADIELTPQGWTKLFGSARSGPRDIRIGPFTRAVEAGLLFTAPPVEGADGVIGLGLLDSFGLILDGPARRAELIGAPTLPAAQNAGG